MKIYDKIVQGTDEWKELRHGKVGGSTASKVMTKLDKSVTDCAVFSDMLSEWMEDFDPFQSDYQSAAMQRGNEYEPLARDEYSRITGNTVKQIGWAEMEEADGFVGISPDGLVGDKKAIEIKCPSANTHVRYMLDFDEFLEEYCWQIVHNFLVLEVDTVDCISYRPENKVKPIIIYTVTKDTVIKISAKVSKPIHELVTMLEARLIELYNGLQKELVNQTKTIEF
jgi:predicted phage-related endonuclease